MIREMRWCCFTKANSHRNRTGEHYFCHLLGGILLECHLGMAIGSLQKACVAMSRKFRYCLFVYATVEQGGYKIVAQSVEMKSLGKTVFIKDLSKMLCEGVRVDMFSILSSKEILAERDAIFLSILLLKTTIGENEIHHIIAHVDRAGFTVLGRTFGNTMSENRS